jgi:hypothetical protein
MEELRAKERKVGDARKRDANKECDAVMTTKNNTKTENKTINNNKKRLKQRKKGQERMDRDRRTDER